MKKLFALALALALFGCGAEKLDGTYASSWNGRSITFNSNGTAVVTIEEGTKQIGDPLHYSVEGNVITVGSLQLKKMEDGTLDGGAAYGKMTKK